MLRSLCLAALLTTPAAADCLTADSLKTGITFTRADHSVGHIQTEGRGAVVNYVTNHNGWYDKRTVTAGVFETDFTASLTEEVMVGSTVPEFKWSFRPKPAQLTAGQSWTGTIRQVESSTSFGAQMVEHPSKQSSDMTATYTALAETEAKLSGCTYRIMPVEATFAAQDGPHTRRWIVFPDLGFGLETKRDGVGNGLIALTAG